MRLDKRLRERLIIVIISTVPLLSGACTSDAGTNDSDKQDDHLRFINVTDQVGLPTQTTRSWGSVWADFHGGDGLPDLFVNRHGRFPWLLANGHDGFTLLEEDFYPEFVDRHGCAWGEANGDGLIDFLCTQGADEGRGTGPKQLQIQTADGFVDQAPQLGVANPFGRGRSANWLDVDLDGDLDIFLGNKFRPPEQSNILFENLGGRFRQATVGLEADLKTVNSTWSDWDGDGDPDLLVMQYPPAKPVAYENLGGTFEATDIAPLTDRPWLSAAWGDHNRDGRPDVHLVNEEGAVLAVNTGDGFRIQHEMTLNHGRMSVWIDVDNDGVSELFVVQGASKEDEVGAETNYPDFLIRRRPNGLVRLDEPSVAGPSNGFGDAVSVADYNRDGKLDLFVTNGFGPAPAKGPSILLENRSTVGNWLGVRLRGDPANPLGFGSVISIETEDISYRRLLTDEFNFRSQSEVGYVHLGIGEATTADIEIEWPDGSTTCYSSPANQVVDALKGSGDC